MQGRWYDLGYMRSILSYIIQRNPVGSRPDCSKRPCWTAQFTVSKHRSCQDVLALIPQPMQHLHLRLPIRNFAVLHSTNKITPAQTNTSSRRALIAQVWKCKQCKHLNLSSSSKIWDEVQTGLQFAHQILDTISIEAQLSMSQH